MRKKTWKGKVILIGAGPGDPGLLTRKGESFLRAADTVVYDALINSELLGLAPQAEKIDAGKKRGLHLIEQGKINSILARSARQGKLVIRLKGGDPFIFGRGGEEADFLARRRIPFEVVPGVSAGTGAPAYAGIPLTDRRISSYVTFLTGHPGNLSPKGDSPLWGTGYKGSAERGGTLVIFMSAKNLPEIVGKLLKSGKSPKTPAAVIERGTFPNQRVIEGTLGNLAAKARRAKLVSPALTVVGDVVRLRKKLKWFEKLPLQGKRIMVTRARSQAGELSARLSVLGAEVIECPTIRIVPPGSRSGVDRAIAEIARNDKWPPPYDWLIFTSANGVESFFERVRSLGKDARIFSNLRIAVIGEATAEALRQKGLEADLVPAEFTNQALFETLNRRGEIAGKKFLLARVANPPPELGELLLQAGGEVTEIETYRTLPAKTPGTDFQKLLRKGKIDFVTFTSSSTVRNFFDTIPLRLRKSLSVKPVSIGPVTSRTLREYGVKPAREAKVHTVEGLVECLLKGGRKK